jgi:hypothetical protein
MIGIRNASRAIIAAFTLFAAAGCSDPAMHGTSVLSQAAALPVQPFGANGVWHPTLGKVAPELGHWLAHIQGMIGEGGTVRAYFGARRGATRVLPEEQAILNAIGDRGMVPFVSLGPTWRVRVSESDASLVDTDIYDEGPAGDFAEDVTVVFEAARALYEAWPYKNDPSRKIIFSFGNELNAAGWFFKLVPANRVGLGPQYLSRVRFLCSAELAAAAAAKFVKAAVAKLSAYEAALSRPHADIVPLAPAITSNHETSCTGANCVVESTSFSSGSWSPSCGTGSWVDATYFLDLMANAVPDVFDKIEAWDVHAYPDACWWVQNQQYAGPYDPARDYYLNVHKPQLNAVNTARARRGLSPLARFYMGEYGWPKHCAKHNGSNIILPSCRDLAPGESGWLECASRHYELAMRYLAGLTQPKLESALVFWIWGDDNSYDISTKSASGQLSPKRSTVSGRGPYDALKAVREESRRLDAQHLVTGTRTRQPR